MKTKYKDKFKDMNFHQRVAADYYSNIDMEYPETPEKKCTNCDNHHSDFKNTNYCSHCGVSLKTLVKIHEKFVEDKKLYNQKMSEKAVEFKKDLLDEYEVTCHPKAEKAYALAYENGHSGGFNDIMCSFMDFVQLLADDDEKFWFVQADHPTAARVDKYGLTEAAAYHKAATMKKLDYENIVVSSRYLVKQP